MRAECIEFNIQLREQRAISAFNKKYFCYFFGMFKKYLYITVCISFNLKYKYSEELAHKRCVDTLQLQ